MPCRSSCGTIPRGPRWACRTTSRLVLTRRRLQLFLWYELPRKWLLPDDKLVRIPPALAELLDLAGPATASYAELCRSEVTDRMIRAEGEGCFELIDASGVEPPDTQLLEWGDFMALEEAEERERAAVLLEEAIDRGELDPRAEGWREAQRRLLDAHLRTPSPDGSTPLDRIHAARIDAWLGPAGVPDGLGEERRATLELVVPLLEGAEPSEVEAAAAIEPLLWLLALVADGVQLTQTNALPRSIESAPGKNRTYARGLGSAWTTSRNGLVKPKTQRL